jgi:hypothetical protein
VGLDVEFTGAMPVSLRLPVEDAEGLEGGEGGSSGGDDGGEQPQAEAQPAGDQAE